MRNFIIAGAIVVIAVMFLSSYKVYVMTKSHPELSYFEILIMSSR